MTIPRLSHKIFAAAVILFAALPLFASEGSLRLTSNGATDYTIVLPETPTVVQQTAAAELASFLNQVTGADFPVLSESRVEQEAKDKKKLLVIGPGELSKKLLAFAAAEPEETIGQDGIIIQTVGDSIILSGHPERGPLYAVYTFLEDTVGIRWWTSTESTIPSRPVLEVEAAPLRYAPRVISRESFYRDPRDGRVGGIFSARTKTNGHFNPVPPEFGGHMPFCLFVHSFYPILPPKDYFDEHPDWYALSGGKRLRENGQLCLTNPEMKKEFIRNTLAILERHPETKIISISQNDCGGWCQCEQCQKLVDENGSQAGPLIAFVNDVAEAIEKEYPDVLVDTLAYQLSRIAPEKVRPRDNVLIRLCTIENSFLTPLEEGGPNQSLVENIEKWSAISKQLFIWDYVTNFHNYMLPHPNLQVLAPNIRFFVKNRAIGIFEQGDTYCAAGDFVRMRNWVISKLLWNPDLDQRRLEDEFLNGYYSPKVGAILREYLDLISESALKSNIHLRCYMETTYGWLDTPTLVELTAMMNQAIAAAREDEGQDPEHFAGLIDKVERESIPVHLAWLCDWPLRRGDLLYHNIPSPIGEVAGYFEEFRALLEKNSVSSAVEGGNGSLDNWLERLREKVMTEPVVPDEVKDLPYGSWFNLEEYAMELAKLGTWSFIEDDAAAENGKTVRLPGDHHQWAIGWDSNMVSQLRSPSETGPDEKGYVKARVILRARCQASDGDDGEALRFGIWDWTRSANSFSRTLKTSELGKEEYKTIDFGVVPFSPSARLWISPAARPEAVQNIYVDRVVLIRE